MRVSAQASATDHWEGISAGKVAWACPTPPMHCVTEQVDDLPFGVTLSF